MNYAEADVDLVVIGGGAAGFFAAIQAAENNPNLKILILEGTRRPLTKVRISGGGRCNVTHACFEAQELIKNYPRGSKELRQAFSHFQPRDTIAWFARHNVELHVEKDGRMFPKSNSSQTIIDLFLRRLEELNIELEVGQLVKWLEKAESGYRLKTQNKSFLAKNIVLTTGSFGGGHHLAQSLGHTITPLAPSLFTFVIENPLILSCPGISFEYAECKLMTDGETFIQNGPILFTHWGLSGPAILKLSAWAARDLLLADYNAKLTINLFPDQTPIQLKKTFDEYKTHHPLRTVANYSPFPIPLRLWENLVDGMQIEKTQKYAELKKELRDAVIQKLTRLELEVTGKGEFKDEFVTCGGVKRKEIDFKTMESRLCKGVYFAGEIIDIDGITGGFNFQNAWTGGFLIGQALKR